MSDERRFPSSDATRVIDEQDLRRLLADTVGPEAEKPYAPVPSEEITRPEILVCLRCGGSQKTVVEVAHGRYAGPRACPRCKATAGLDPGTPYDPGDPFAGDLPEPDPAEEADDPREPPEYDDRG